MGNDAFRSAYSLYLQELEEAVVLAGGEKWRGAQAWQWLYSGKAQRWDDMSNMPKALRAALGDKLLDLDGTAMPVESRGESGGTAKTLLRLHDGELMETVLIPAGARRTVCVSSQVGCAFGCAFCASGVNGITRNLEAGEIVAQVMRVMLACGGDRIDNVVFMGIGEPFANYDNVLRAARILNDGKGLNIGARKITFSTCGVVPGIKRLAGEGMQFELSVSLHAPGQELRERIMPVAKRWGLEELMAACRDYTASTNRIITFEYTMIDGFNSGPEHARMLSQLLRGLMCRVNLIPLNPVSEFEGRAPSMETCERFMAALSRSGINATLRRSKGRDIDASCGQLRQRRIAKDNA